MEFTLGWEERLARWLDRIGPPRQNTRAQASSQDREGPSWLQKIHVPVSETGNAGKPSILGSQSTALGTLVWQQHIK